MCLFGRGEVYGSAERTPRRHANTLAMFQTGAFRERSLQAHSCAYLGDCEVARSYRCLCGCSRACGVFVELSLLCALHGVGVQFQVVGGFPVVQSCVFDD